MSSLLFAELAATCNSLGYSDGLKYFTDPQCQEAVKDLIKYLRRDDENHEIRRYLGEAKILQTDLIPILKQHNDDKDIFDHVLRLLVNLTYSALVLYNAELPEDKTARFYYLQIISHLQSYKEAFADEGLWAVLCQKLGYLLNIEWQDRSEDEGKIIERILTLMRNVLQVPADSDAEKRPDNDATIHDQVLWALYQSGIVGLLHYIISSKQEDRFHMHVLEIISHMLRDQNPAYLAQAEVQRSIEEKTRDEAELLAIRQKEAQERHLKNEKYTGLKDKFAEKPRIRNFLGRRFAGTYVLKDVKSISSNDMIYHKPLTSLTALDLNHDKKKVKKPKNKQPPADTMVERRSTLSVRLFLKEFCIEFLNGAYNTLMYSVKEMIHHGKNQANDESYYLWAMRFFMEFNRHYKAEMKLISETMSIQTFHFIQTQIEHYQERMLIDKKKVFVWARRMHLALRAYQELLMTLMTMDHSNDNGIKESARVIKSNIFYVVEYRELLLLLVTNYNQARFSRTFLKDLIETVHTFMKLLEQFCTRSRGIIVQDKLKQRRRKLKKKSSQNNGQNIMNTDPEQMWESCVSELTTVVENMRDVPEDVVPFDSTSDVPIDEQKLDAAKRIQQALRDKQFEQAIGLLRASREVWPENDHFGAPNPAPEEEVLALKEIFHVDLGQPMRRSEEPSRTSGDHNEEEEESEEDNETEEKHVDVSEKTFQFMDFVKRFCNPRVVEACGLLLRQFDQNSVRTNHCILKLMHRIAWDCKLPSMIFQASIFRTFQRILESENILHKELKKFCVFITRKFVEVAQKNSKVYMELLFWKNSKDAYEIESGYGTYQGETHSAKQAWAEEEEDELRRLYEEYFAMSEKPMEGDMVDWILRNLISDHRSRRGVIKKLKEMGCAVPTKTSRKSVNSRLPVQWSTEEEEQLTALYNQFKDAYDPLSCILDRLTIHRPKPRVVDKLLAMGLVQDKKELRKKRKKKNQSFGDHDDREDVSDGETDSYGSHSGSESESGNESLTNALITKGNSKVSKKNSKTKHTVSKSIFSPREVTQLVRKVRDAGMHEALDWLAESLEDLAEEAEDFADESTPLLPLTDACIVAMDEPLFHQLLCSLGINPPADEQETYWRIPGNLSTDDLRSRKALIEAPISEEFMNTEEFDRHIAEECRKVISRNEKELEKDGDNINDYSSTFPSSSIQTPSFSQSTNNEDTILNNHIHHSSTANPPNELVTNRLVGNHSSKKTKKGRKLKVIKDNSSDSENEMHEQNKTLHGDKEEHSKQFLNSDSETKNLNAKLSHKSILNNDSYYSSASNSPNESGIYSHTGNSGSKKVKNRGKLKIINDSSSESENEQHEQNNIPHDALEENSKRFLDSDSDTENPKAKKSRKLIVVSDDED